MIILWILALLGVANAQEKSPPSVHAAYSRQEASNYSGNWTELGAEFSPKKTWRLGAHVQRVYRVYLDGGSITDAIYGISAAHSFQHGYYFESGVSVAPNARVSPLTAVSFTPRKVIGSVDLGLGLDYRRYKDSTAGSVHPNAIYDVNKYLTLKAGAFVVRADKTLFSTHGEVVVRPFEGHRAKLGAAGGQTIEDAGVSARFSNLYAGYGVPLWRTLVSIEAANYWSETRFERSYGLRVEFK